MKEAHKEARFQCRRTVRLSKLDEHDIALQADMAGLSVAEYMRRKLVGSGPITARVDVMMINELRRIGGLLKHNFTTLRQAEAPKELFIAQETALAELRKLIELIGESYDHQKAAKKERTRLRAQQINDIVDYIKEPHRVNPEENRIRGYKKFLLRKTQLAKTGDDFFRPPIEA